MRKETRPPLLPTTLPTNVGPSRWLTRLLVAVLVVPVTGALALFGMAMSGWGFETDPGAQLQRDLPMLITTAAAGALCGAALGFALAGPRRAVILPAMLLGVVPAVAKATAYFTSAY